MGFMFQSAQLLPFLKVEEQLLYVAKLAKLSQKGSEGARRLSAEASGDLGTPQPLPRTAVRGRKKQRVAIARAWMNKPAILFADEPTASLDYSRGREVVRMIADEVRSEGKAAVMVTHDERMLDWCDRVLHLEDGVLVEAHSLN
ncbi:ATP-binding cassette domain-containing protein [Paenibacillus rhizoplanae]